MLRGRSVADVRLLFGQQGADGIGDVLARSSVSGVDLASFTSCTELVSDLHMTPFAARKALRLRGAFLSGAVSMF